MRQVGPTGGEEGHKGRKTPPRPKSKRGRGFQSGPGATRTRDLLLRSAGPTASRRQRALILPGATVRAADQRSPATGGIVIKNVIKAGTPQKPRRGSSVTQRLA